ncbi:aminotransferase [Phlebopus sp. FC_14]|nr:aminotransferase [Phlebopus sp. FC_14]
MTFSLLCTLRFDRFLETLQWNNDPDGNPSPYLLLMYQFERLVASARLNRWAVSDTLTLANLRAVCDKAVQEAKKFDGNTSLKIRVTLASSGELSATPTSVEPLRYDPTMFSLFNPETDSHALSVPVLIIDVDTQPTSNMVPMKTTNRQVYDDARARAGIPLVGTPRPSVDLSDCADDVILYNGSNAVTESSICNVAFYRNGRWVTPPLRVGCISGVFRRWLLEHGRVCEAVENQILLNTITDQEWVLVFNGVMGCRLGQVRLPQGV